MLAFPKGARCTREYVHNWGHPFGSGALYSSEVSAACYETVSFPRKILTVLVILLLLQLNSQARQHSDALPSTLSTINNISRVLMSTYTKSLPFLSVPSTQPRLVWKLRQLVVLSALTNEDTFQSIWMDRNPASLGPGTLSGRHGPHGSLTPFNACFLC